MENQLKFETVSDEELMEVSGGFYMYQSGIGTYWVNPNSGGGLNLGQAWNGFVYGIKKGFSSTQPH
mgnify:CR=1 FL=1